MMSIEALVADLKPIRRISPGAGLAIAVSATTSAVLGTAMIFGLRPDVLALAPSEIVMLRSGALLLMGLAAAVGAVAGVRPGIGTRSEGWRWAVALWLLFPLTSLALSFESGFPQSVLTSSSVLYCLGISLTSAVAVGASLLAWLRRGAVTNLARSGWLVGLAAGALGTFAYSLNCPSSTVHYAGLWYSVTVGISALAGRLVAPRLLRW